jgi:nucleoside-diphosphate kinase
MALEFTLAILKPDFLRRKHSIDTIEGALKSKGLEVVAKRDFSKWPEANVERFYGEHRGRFFYPRLVHYMGTGPISAVILKGPKAVSAWRELIGPTHLKNARKTKGCLRGEFAISDTKNSFHGSDSIPNAKDEIIQFFPDIDFATILEPTSPTTAGSL